MGKTLQICSCSPPRSRSPGPPRRARGRRSPTRARAWSSPRGRASPARSGRSGRRRLAYAAVVRRSATAFRRPGAGRLAVFRRLNVNGVPTVLGVRGVVLGAALPGRVVPRPAPAAAERDRRLRARVGGRHRPRPHADRRRPLRAARDALPERAQGDRDARGDRLERDADPDRPLLRQPAPDPERPRRPVRARRDRHLRLLGRAHRLDAGRADRDPRHEPAVVDRAGGLERLRPRPERDAAAALRRRARRHARRSSGDRLGRDGARRHAASGTRSRSRSGTSPAPRRRRTSSPPPRGSRRSPASRRSSSSTR